MIFLYLAIIVFGLMGVVLVFEFSMILERPVMFVIAAFGITIPIVFLSKFWRCDLTKNKAMMK